MCTNEISHSIHLVDERCHPDEAWVMLQELMDERSTQHNINMLRKWESNHGFDSRPYDHQIKKMQTQCREAKTLLEEAKSRGLTVEVKVHFEVRMTGETRSNRVNPTITKHLN